MSFLQNKKLCLLINRDFGCLLSLFRSSVFRTKAWIGLWVLVTPKSRLLGLFSWLKLARLWLLIFGSWPLFRFLFIIARLLMWLPLDFNGSGSWFPPKLGSLWCLLIFTLSVLMDLIDLSWFWSICSILESTSDWVCLCSSVFWIWSWYAFLSFLVLLTNRVFDILFMNIGILSLTVNCYWKLI